MAVFSNNMSNRIKKTLWKIRQAFDYSSLHPVREMQKIALQESVQYIQQNFPSAFGLVTTKETLNFALDQCSENGYYLEFGVWKGTSIRWIARKARNHEIHGFDSFTGLPENWAGHFFVSTSFFDLQGNLPKVPKNVKLHPGMFDETLPVWLSNHSGAVAFIHIDCDLYESTKCVFQNLADRIIPGTIIIFDEYFNYPGWQQHEYLAFQEFVKEHNVVYEYLAYSRHQIVARIKSINAKKI